MIAATDMNPEPPPARCARGDRLEACPTEGLKIVGLCVAAAVVYGVLHDQVTARVCLEYFTVYHPPLIDSEDPTVVGLAWGVVATWWVGVMLGLGLACAALLGPWPRRTAASLVRPVVGLMAASAVLALAAGVVGYLTGGGAFRGIGAQYGAGWADRFAADAHAHFTSYAVGFVGGVGLCGGVAVSRLSKSRVQLGKSRYGTLSVVIPTLNEAAALPATLGHAFALDLPACEVIVADGGSTDGTRDLAAGAGAKVVTSAPGRARQMNAGAAAATGDLLAFLHADTVPPADLVAHVRDALADERTSLVGFTAVLCGPAGVSRLTTLHHRAKTYYGPAVYRPHRFLFGGLRLLFGDQLICCRRSDFASIGGFDGSLPVMEEADLCLRMNRLGRVRQLPPRVRTSDRRVRAWGVLRSNLTFLAVSLAWAGGVPPRWLDRWYPHVR